MITSKFDPLKHCLPYRNGSFKAGVGNWSVLCGGLSYTALDYFYTGIKPPQSPKTPADGNPMLDYIYRRQITAHYYTWHLFAAAWAGNIPIVSPIRGLVEDTLGDLCKYLPYRPVILCLFGGMFQGHHVVAAACDPARKQIRLYDSNHPGKVSLLTQVGDGWLHSISGTSWKGWFMDWGHYHDGTKMPPLAFRYCHVCHGLNTVSLGVQGGCISGTHNNDSRFEYFLPWKSGEGQGGWKVCGKCQGIYRQTGADVPFCLSMGMHLPQTNNSNWQELHVNTSGDGSTGWRRCGVCTSLFWVNKADFGKCCVDAHSPVPNESYVVDNRTV